MKGIFGKTFHIASADVDMFGRMRPSALLAIFQNIEAEHAKQYNSGKEYFLNHYHAVWLTARAWYHLYRPIKRGETITVQTSVRPAESFVFYRDFTIISNDETAGKGISASVAEDIDTGKELWLPWAKRLSMIEIPGEYSDKKLKLIQHPAERKKLFSKYIRLSDLDENGHINYTKYADTVLDALEPDFFTDQFIEEFQLNYTMGCHYGEEIEIFRSLKGNRCYVYGCSKDGVHYFDSAIQFAKRKNMG